MKPRFLSANIGNPIARKIAQESAQDKLPQKERSHNAIHQLTHWLLISRGAQSKEIVNWQSVAS